jgi:hypothetical protein
VHHCSTKRGVFLMSLKALLETGKGAPEPNDIKIDNWTKSRTDQSRRVRGRLRSRQKKERNDE